MSTFGSFPFAQFFFDNDVLSPPVLHITFHETRNLMLCSEAFLSVDGDRNGRVEKEEIKGMLQK